jgi:hypothetical protein
MTYRELSLREDVYLCTGCNGGPLGPYNHQRGFAAPSRGTVHWAERHVTRNGLRHFLMLVAAIKHKHQRGQPKWLIVYEQNVYAYHRALTQYHVRLGRKLSLTDRAKVRLWMGKAGVLSSDEYRNVARWAMERD